MPLHVISIACFLIQYFGYVVLSTWLQFYFYRLTDTRKPEKLTWKVQPSQNTNVGPTADGGWSWWPVLPQSWRKHGRASDHGILATVNLLIGSFFAGFVAEATIRGQSSLMTEWPEHLSTWSSRAAHILLWFAVSYAHENVIEYFWHRLMHLRSFYGWFHKIHHFYKHPEPFDDLYIHPVEAFGYYCILHSPAFLYPQHFAAYLAYMVFMGATGVFDHCGAHITLPWGIYNSADHDLHHERTVVNFGFPHMFMDILFSTYTGNIWGATYLAADDPTRRAPPPKRQQRAVRDKLRVQ